MVKTPTIKQLLTIQAQIESTNKKLGELKSKRRKMLDASPTVKRPRAWVDKTAETFIRVDGKPCRLLVDIYGDIQLEELPL
jgi:hypothetical protein